MKFLAFQYWPARLALTALLAACGGDDSARERSEPEVANTALTSAEQETRGLALCCQLGALCHPGPQDPIDGLVYNCHQMGHENDPARCSAQFDGCMEACLGDREPRGVEEHGCI